MYSKLFTAGLNATGAPSTSTDVPSSPRPPLSSLSTRSSWPTDSSSSTTLSRNTSMSRVFSPTLEIATPSLFSSRQKKSGELFFTLRQRSRHSKSAKRHPPPAIPNENDLRSFLSLDLAESTKSIRSRRLRNGHTLSVMSSLDEHKEKSVFLPSLKSTRRASASVPNPKPAPLLISVPPPPPPNEPSSAPPFGSYGNLYRAASTTSAITARPSVKRANRFDALAALEGRHKRSFWDADEEDELEGTTGTSAFTDSSATSSPDLVTPPPLPLQDMSMNIDLQFPAVPVIGETSHAKRRKRASTIESWFVPTNNLRDYLNELSSATENEMEEDKESWMRLVGVNLALVS